MRAFKQITKNDRTKISRLRAIGFSISEIARKIGKNKSSVSRELKRNGIVITSEDLVFQFSIEESIDPDFMLDFLKSENKIPEGFTDWTAEAAQRQCEHRRAFTNKIRREKQPKTIDWIIKKLKLGWTPEQIAGRSKIDGPEKVSHECIYQLIKKRKQTGQDLRKYLKRFKKRKQRLSTREYNIRIPERVGIEYRPKIVDKRERKGDLEADLIQGYRSDGYVLTVLDRFSRFVILKKLNSKRMDEVGGALISAIKEMGLTHTLTVDNGREFAAHRKIAKEVGIKVYFGKPYSTNDRASVENMNGQIRMYLPKKTPFLKLTPTRLYSIQNKLNHRPRKCLNFLTPFEVHTK